MEEIELEKCLLTLSGKIETIEQMEKHKGEKFNIFSILNMERREVETHSMFLYELLNPDGSHFQGMKYLEIFIKEVLEINDFKYENVKVGRETFTDTSRRIDFTIVNDEYYIAIEMKVDAGDQEEQIKDYSEFAKKQSKPNVKLCYLTLNGKDASEKSVKDTEYSKISFQSDILEFIEKSIEKSVSLPIIRETLIQYKNLIKKITNQTTQDITMEVEKIIKTPEMAKSATLLAQNLGYVWALREVKFWKTLTDTLNEYLETNMLDKEGWVILYYGLFNEDNIGEPDEVLAQEISKERAKKDSENGISIMKDNFELDVYSFNSENLRFYIKHPTNLENISKDCGITRKHKEAGRWTASKYSVNFSKDYNAPTYDIFSDKMLEEIVENVAKEVESYMEKIIQVLK